jgi:hypothetical protein
VTNVENQAVFHCIKNGLNCNRKLDSTQIGSKVTTGLSYTGNQKVSNFVAQISPLLIIQAGQIIMRVNIR